MSRYNDKDKTKHELRETYFIKGEYNEETQVNEHLSFDELIKVFMGLYDNTTSYEKRVKHLEDENLKSKIKHVENCPDCLGFLISGHSLYWDLTGNAIDLDKEKFIEYFKYTYDKCIESSKEKQIQCKKFIHLYYEWVHYEKGINNMEEWSRICKECGYIDRTNEMPSELKRK